VAYRRLIPSESGIHLLDATSVGPGESGTRPDA
jgi:hypothetical protein